MFDRPSMTTASMITGCGDARFGSFGAYREFGRDVRKQQAAIVQARAALAKGVKADSALLLLRVDLAEAGMDAETIHEHLADLRKDVAGLFISSVDL